MPESQSSLSQNRTTTRNIPGLESQTDIILYRDPVQLSEKLNKEMRAQAANKKLKGGKSKGYLGFCVQELQANSFLKNANFATLGGVRKQPKEDIEETKSFLADIFDSADLNVIERSLLRRRKFDYTVEVYGNKNGATGRIDSEDVLDSEFVNAFESDKARIFMFDKDKKAVVRNVRSHYDTVPQFRIVSGEHRGSGKSQKNLPNTHIAHVCLYQANVIARLLMSSFRGRKFMDILYGSSQSISDSEGWGDKATAVIESQIEDLSKLRELLEYFVVDYPAFCSDSTQTYTVEQILDRVGSKVVDFIKAASMKRSGFQEQELFRPTRSSLNSKQKDKPLDRDDKRLGDPGERPSAFFRYSKKIIACEAFILNALAQTLRCQCSLVGFMDGIMDDENSRASILETIHKTWMQPLSCLEFKKYFLPRFITPPIYPSSREATRHSVISSYCDLLYNTIEDLKCIELLDALYDLYANAITLTRDEIFSFNVSTTNGKGRVSISSLDDRDTNSFDSSTLMYEFRPDLCTTIISKLGETVGLGLSTLLTDYDSFVKVLNASEAFAKHCLKWEFVKGTPFSVADADGSNSERLNANWLYYQFIGKKYIFDVNLAALEQDSTTMVKFIRSANDVQRILDTYYRPVSLAEELQSYAVTEVELGKATRMARIEAYKSANWPSLLLQSKLFMNGSGEGLSILDVEGEVMDIPWVEMKPTERRHEKECPTDIAGLPSLSDGKNLPTANGSFYINKNSIASTTLPTKLTSRKNRKLAVDHGCLFIGDFSDVYMIQQRMGGTFKITTSKDQMTLILDTERDLFYLKPSHVNKDFASFGDASTAYETQLNTSFCAREEVTSQMDINDLTLCQVLSLFEGSVLNERKIADDSPTEEANLAVWARRHELLKARYSLMNSASVRRQAFMLPANPVKSYSVSSDKELFKLATSGINFLNEFAGCQKWCMLPPNATIKKDDKPLPVRFVRSKVQHYNIRVPLIYFSQAARDLLRHGPFDDGTSYKEGLTRGKLSKYEEQNIIKIPFSSDDKNRELKTKNQLAGLDGADKTLAALILTLKEEKK